MTSQRFPRDARVRARADFDRIFQQGRRCALPVLALHWQAGDTPPRLGLAVSRKVDRRAVGRNRIKRILRETFRRLRPALAGGDYVLVARAAAAQRTHEELAEAFVSLLRRARALADSLPESAAPGTMPAAPLPPDAARESTAG